MRPRSWLGAISVRTHRVRAVSALRRFSFQWFGQLFLFSWLDVPLREPPLNAGPRQMSSNFQIPEACVQRSPTNSFDECELFLINFCVPLPPRTLSSPGPKPKTARACPPNTK